MDCGPAALKCLLEGFGVSVSYGRLREACQTSVDGTSIDTLESLARMLGLDAEQIMLPADHVVLPGADALPAIVVVRLPTGLTHFVVLWRRYGRWVQVMDPARGRRWVTGDELTRELYVHTMSVPADSWREWAMSDGFAQPLGQRLRRLGIGEVATRRYLDGAKTDPGWRRLAALDAAVRMVGALVDGGGVKRGEEAERIVDRLVDGPERAEVDGALLAPHAVVQPAPAGADGEAQVSIKGAVLVRAGGLRGAEASPETSPDASGGSTPAALPRELRAALDEAPARPAKNLFLLLRQDGVLRWSALGAALLLAAGAAVFETVLFRWLLNAASGGLPVTLTALLLAFVAGVLLLELPLGIALRAAGQRLEQRLRGAFLKKIPRLGDRYFQSRPVSDMAERAHLVHRLRLLPGLGGQFVRTVAELAVTTAALSWLHPPSARLAVPLALAMIAIPLALRPVLGERDLRMRNHAGGLARFYLDALLGLTVIRTHRAEGSFASEHRERLHEWRDAARALLRTAVASEGLQALVGFALGAWLLVDFLIAGAGAAAASGSVLLVLYWALNLPVLGQEIAYLVQQYPAQRNITLRLVEPLGALEDDAGSAVKPPVEHGPQPSGAPASAVRRDGVAIEIDDCVVQAGGNVILTVPALRIGAGERVAVVGPSGAGKSSLVGLLLGWFRPAAGKVSVDGQPLLGDALERLRRHTAWVDPTVYLWNRPLAYNLGYGLPDPPASLAELATILDGADLREVARRLPADGSAALGEAGALVSGGEGQRVRFGRALLRPDCRLAILDEPFRGLDRQQRRTLMARARQRWADATLLCVTHDLAETLSFARVLVVDGGRIVEDGAPAALAAQAGSRYAALLAAEETVRVGLWSPEQPAGAVGHRSWRRMRLERGQLTEEGGRGT